MNIKNKTTIPKIKVKNKKNSERNKIEDISKQLIENIKVPIENVNKNKNGEIIVKCSKNEDVNGTIEKLKEGLGEEYEVECGKMDLPKMKIVGIENYMNDFDIENDINTRNFSEIREKCKVKHHYKSGENKISVIIESPKELYEFIRNNNNKVYVGTKRCVAYDCIDIKLCEKCCRFNHNSHKCENNQVCPHCSEQQSFQKCVNKDK